MADTVAVMNGGPGRAARRRPPTSTRTRAPPSSPTSSAPPTSSRPRSSRPSGERARRSRPGDAKLRLPAGAVRAAARTGGKVLVGVRPEKISLAHADDAGAIADGRNRLTGTHRRRQLHRRLHAVRRRQPRSAPNSSVYEQNIERDARLVPGAEVVLHWSPAHTFGLDAAQDIDGRRGDRRRGGRRDRHRRRPRHRTQAGAARPGGAQEPPARKRRSSPYWLLLPGILWLLVFFAAPLVYQASTSVQTGSLEEGFKVTWHFATYWDALATTGRSSCARCCYAATATVAVPAARLPARLPDRLPGGPLAQPGAGPGHRAVLHQLPDPHARLEDDPRRRRPGRRRRSTRCTSWTSPAGWA